MPAKPMVFVNIGWMKDYAGPSANDTPVGGHGYLKDGNIGHEVFNFASLDGKVYGYVPRSARINLKNPGGSSSDELVTAVTVVWIARNPSDKKTYIVGWYRDASVFRDNNHIKLKRSKNFIVTYQIEAPADKATLLPIDQRLFRIPTAKEEGNLGQSPVWYGGKDEFRAEVSAYLAADGTFAEKPKVGLNGAKYQTDPELRKRIELAAVRHATAYYRSRAGGSQVVASVEKDGVGWDLNVTAPTGAVLKVEVKGLSGRDLLVELTPNEFAKMRSTEHRAQYIIYVVTEALTSEARSHVFRHNAESSKGGNLVWATADGRQLKIQQIVAARLSAPYETIT
ncbi:hypothetical protein PMNALOAF_1822 [Methylobacterium adhaesivum]|uniref:DUF3883 domain-containing protein n=1 Tax=Methylobacterium adhaesivum TaxID=333297 RepID=A0ABT8BE61_9HYPH|nr:DUF3883 domain-containing protein [Methylobacterium adhaesivum]MDN3589560.1 DUF3883 domain-containing protein [Methylobacterium adhaesivum]GJD30575.1 hypothetical protein PMNALOAF_1822 [Methylobacterium adhaesivum]